MKWKASVVQETIFKGVFSIFNSVLSYTFKILLEAILTKMKIFCEDTFSYILFTQII